MRTAGVIALICVLACAAGLAVLFSVTRDPGRDAYEKGLVYAKKGQYAHAIEAFTTAHRLSPKNPGTLINRANAYDAQSKFPEAIRDYDAALALAKQVSPNPKDPRLAEIYYNRGYTYARMGAFAKAADDYRQTIKLAPNTEDVQNNLAWLLATCPADAVRNGKEAIAHARTACEQTNWEADYILDTLAAAYAEAGDFENALKWEREAVKKAGSYKAEFADRVKLYEAKKPYRETSVLPLRTPIAE